MGDDDGNQISGQVFGTEIWMEGSVIRNKGRMVGYDDRNQISGWMFVTEIWIEGSVISCV